HTRSWIAQFSSVRPRESGGPGLSSRGVRLGPRLRGDERQRDIECTHAAPCVGTTSGDADEKREAGMKSEVRDGVQIDREAPIAMEGGLILRADVVRPARA